MEINRIVLNQDTTFSKIKEISKKFKGPDIIGGYLSPSTISDFHLCPRRVYLKKVTREIPYTTSLAAIFGQIFAKVMEVTFNEYKEVDWVNLVEEELESALKSEDRPFVEIAIKGMTQEEFDKNLEKRKADLLRTLDKFFKEDWLHRIAPEKNDIVSMERPFLTVIEGIPVYCRLDLELRDMVWDFKYTAASMVKRKAAATGSDFQLWIQEVASKKPSGLLLISPPPKRIKNRPLIVKAKRTGNGRLLSNNLFVDMLKNVNSSIRSNCFTPKAKTFIGSCADCPAYKICTKKLD